MMKYRRSFMTAVIFGLLTWLAVPLVALPSQVLRALDDQSFAALADVRGAHLDVRVGKAENLVPSLQIYTGSFGQKTFSLERHGISKESPTRAFIPYFELSPPFKKVFLKKLWPDDKIKGGFWTHRVEYDGQETLWSIAQWFTGSGQNYHAIKKASGLRSDRIGRGAMIKIPVQLLLPILREENQNLLDAARPQDPVFAFQAPVNEVETVGSDSAVLPSNIKSPADAATPEAPAPKSTELAVPAPGAKLGSGSPSRDANESLDTSERATPNSIEGESGASLQLEELKNLRRELKWGSDSRGRYGAYALKAGEAIYSAVVVRFCGLVRGEDVNRVAALIIQRNHIRDETDIEIGTELRIPYEYLEPEFRAEDDADYLAYIENLREVSLVRTDVRTRNLEGVHIILDPGHGGLDPGAFFDTVWEDDYVYDIVCRIKERLERESAAVVLTTVLDPSVKYKVQDVRRFTIDHDEFLLTTPRYLLNNDRVTVDGVHLRYIMANHYFQKWVSKGVKPKNIVFASFHADSLHPGIRGKMIYIPDARENPDSVKAPSKFRNYKEYEGNQFQLAGKEKREAQALSLNFATSFINQSRQMDITIHKQKPIRSVIHRNRNRPFVPAVIKLNRIPTRMLIEVCNLNNRFDRELMQRPEFRQKIADSFVDTTYRIYGLNPVTLSASNGSSAGSN